jgi:galactofuranosylgalactofuranosylrhamnosyl-N-acetylglucosaminyl-diphospho-decaprenol beta-1,5/1,6-galactofuranosyltransferase
MNIISKIQFPRTPETSNLYIRCNEVASLNFTGDKTEVALEKNGILSFNTYFNSFYEKFYVKYTELDSLYYCLRLEGSFQVSLYREFSNQKSKELIHKEIYENCQYLEPVEILIPDYGKSEAAGRVYLEITCLSDYGLFKEGLIVTDKPKVREVSLGIITCTFKKEVYVKNTVNAILKDNLLQNKKFKVFVVDNGRTLKQDDFDCQKVQLISNKNVGGSGGFTRGLIQALEEEKYTHFLFMDDDIELDTQSIYRLFPLYEYASQEFAIASGMLDFYKKHIVHEVGALHSQYQDRNGAYRFNPFTVSSLKHNLNLEINTSLNNLLLEDKPDYGGFWFFAFSQAIIEKVGLLMPFFIKVDDVEFCLRIKKNLGLIVCPGIAVWHEPFYSKNPVWDTYYGIRNNLVTHSIHGSLKYTDAIGFLTKSLLRRILLFDYNTAKMMVNGFEDYMKGPSFIKNTDPEELHSCVVSLSKSYKSQSTKISEKTHHQSSKKSNLSIFKTLFGLLTLNGHLLPNFLLSKEEALLNVGLGSSLGWQQALTKKRVVITREGSNSIYEYEINRLAGFELLLRWLQIVVKSAGKWSSVRSEWKNSFNDLTSLKFWKEYLKLDEQTEQPIPTSMVNKA